MINHLEYMMQPPLYLNIGTGQELKQMMIDLPEVSPVLGHTSTIFICIDEMGFQIALGTGDIGEALQSDRVFWFIGENRFKELYDFLRRRPWICEGFHMIAGTYEAQAEIRKLVKDVQSNGPKWSFTPLNFGEKVAVIVPLQSTVLGYAMGNIAKSLAIQGVSVEVISEPTPMDRLTPDWVIHRCNEIHPTHMLNIYAPIAFEHEGMRANTWCQDPTPNYDGVVPTSDKVSCICEEQFDFYLGIGVDHSQLAVAPVAASPDEYPMLPLLPVEYDISFVSNMENLFSQEDIDLIRFGLQHFKDGGGSDTYGFNISRAIKLMRKFKVPPKYRKINAEKYTHSLERFAHRIYWVLLIIEMTERLNLKLGLFGRGWDTIPELAPYHKGSLKGPKAVSDVFRSSNINLHMNSHINMHQRILEAGLSGCPIAFPAINFDELQSGILSYFPDSHLNRFNEATMEETLLRKREDGEKTRSEFREMILANHTYDKRAMDLLNLIR